MSDPDKIYRSVDGNNYVTYREENFYGSDVEYIKSEIVKKREKELLDCIKMLIGELECYPHVEAREAIQEAKEIL